MGDVTQEVNPLDTKYEDGTWNGLPNYGCPYCTFHTLKGGNEVAWHIEDQHREEDEIIPLVETTTSAIVDNDEGGPDAADADRSGDSPRGHAGTSTGSTVSGDAVGGG